MFSPGKLPILYGLTGGPTLTWFTERFHLSQALSSGIANRDRSEGCPAENLIIFVPLSMIWNIARAIRDAIFRSLD
jgi:hypothetical protein